jgi:flagellar FliL protein
LIIGGIGVLMAPLSSVSSKMSEKTSTSAPAMAPQGEGPVVTVGDPLIINLADGHYLKLGMALKLTAGQSERLDTSIATNLAIDNYTGREISDLETEGGREAVKQQLLEKTEAAYNGAVVDIYFTQFVTQ